jgi:N-acetylglucosaminyl-diphospho-decaprenol L-rhamnosyltransferase
MTEPGVAVVVANWNSGPHLDRLLTSLREHPARRPMEVVVVDNGSRDGSAEGAATAPGVRVLRNQRNRGLAAANNQGLVATTAPYVLIANPDVAVGAGAIDALVDCLERHDRAAWAVPQLVFPDGSPQASAGELPTLGQALIGRRARHLWRDGSDQTDERVIGRGAEACYLVRRRAVEEVGAQDERYRLDWEGIDWTARMRAVGWEVWLEPRAVVTHVGGVSISQAGVRWVVESHRGMYRYFADRRPAALRPVLALLIGLRCAVKAGAVAAGLPLYRWAHARSRR